jgi:hypothetical protein
VTAVDLSTVLAILRRIVGAKAERFSNALRRFENEPEKAKAKAIFQTITKPNDQLQVIVAGIYQFFEATRPAHFAIADLNVRVALARMGSQHVESIDVFFPSGQQPRSKISELQREECGFSRAKAAGKIIVVEDFVAEQKTSRNSCYVVTDQRRMDEEGSMICYPVIDRGANNVSYVISVCAAKAKYFKRSESEYYGEILEHFAQRIFLEHCLKSLKSYIR